MLVLKRSDAVVQRHKGLDLRSLPVCEPGVNV